MLGAHGPRALSGRDYQKKQLKLFGRREVAAIEKFTNFPRTNELRRPRAILVGIYLGSSRPMSASFFSPPTADTAEAVSPSAGLLPKNGTSEDSGLLSDFSSGRKPSGQNMTSDDGELEARPPILHVRACKTFPPSPHLKLTCRNSP
jgi:hypothetical protein